MVTYTITFCDKKTDPTCRLNDLRASPPQASLCTFQTFLPKPILTPLVDYR